MNFRVCILDMIQKSMKKTAFLSLLIIAMLIVAIWLYVNNQNQSPVSKTAETDMTNKAITMINPQPDQTITSPITISGQAPGMWYFEGQFPVKLLDATGKTIITSTAIAQGEWMTDDPVPFTAELTFSQPETTTGTLVLQNDNPSGLPENQKEFTVSVRF